MRWLITLAVVTTSMLAVGAQDKKAPPAKRYGVVLDLGRYPQATPKETLASVLFAVDNQRIDYLLAQLADPEFVDERVKKQGGSFEELVKETRTKLADNSDAVKELRRFLKEGEWKAAETSATVTLKDVKDRTAFFKKVEDRWYLENRQQPPKEPQK
jgi:hypothetical protein